MRIEPLEARVAPAVLINFADIDGDAVTIKISKGDPVDVLAQFLITGPFGATGGRQLLLLELLPGNDFDGANISITAKPQDLDGDGIKDGDGRVNVGFIKAVGFDLGKVVVDGDLGAID